MIRIWQWLVRMATAALGLRREAQQEAHLEREDARADFAMLTEKLLVWSERLAEENAELRQRLSVFESRLKDCPLMSRAPVLGVAKREPEQTP